MSLRSRIGQIEKDAAGVPCALCRDVQPGMSMTIGDMTEEEVDASDYDPEGVEPEHPLVVALEEAFPDDYELHCPGCGRIVLRRVTLNVGKGTEEEEEN